MSSAMFTPEPYSIILSTFAIPPNKNSKYLIAPGSRNQHHQSWSSKI